MIEACDLIHLLYTPDLTEGGIACACRALASTSYHMGGSPLERLRRSVGEVAAELAFRRHLSEQTIPFHVRGRNSLHPSRSVQSITGRASL